MVDAVKFCHDHHIVHRDVKMENFLIDTDEDGELIVKLSDFGLAYEFKPEAPPTEKCGSILAIAPELLTDVSYCYKVDVWGLGIILYEMLSTQLPFYSDNDEQYKENIVNEKV